VGALGGGLACGSSTTDVADASADSFVPDATVEPDAATPVHEIGGWIVFTHERRPGQDGLDIVSGSGFFLPVPVSLDTSAPSEMGGSWRDYLDGYTDIPIDTCEARADVSSINDQRWEDAAGEAVTIAGPAGDLVIERVQVTDALGDRFFYSGAGAASLYVSGGEYTLSAPGNGRFGAFEGSFDDAPVDVEDLVPLSPLLVIQQRDDLALTWRAGGHGWILVKLAGSHRRWVCRFSDDGEATIPGSVLLTFPQTNDPLDPNPLSIDVVLSVVRYQWTTLQIEGIGAPLVLASETVAATDMILQGVQCSSDDESACGSGVCNVETGRCMPRVPAGEAGLCQPCISGRQCMPGMVCASMEFGDPSLELGHYCLWRETATQAGGPAGDCSTIRPYTPRLVSLIGGGTERVCGLRATTCTALESYGSRVDCTGPPAPPIVPMDFACGVDVGTGVSIGDGLCRVSDVGYRCTTPCRDDLDCPVDATCRTGSTSYCSL